MNSKEKIIILSGLIDFQISGNQSIKQTVKGLAKTYKVLMISFLPSSHDNIDVDFEKKINDLEVIRSWKLLSIFFSIFKAIKGLNPNKNMVSNKKKISEFSHETEYFEKESSLNQILYVVAQYLYLLIEFPRAIFYVIKTKPKFIYGYENFGGFLASIVGSLTNIGVVKRFQGTPLLLKNGIVKQKINTPSFTIPYKINKKQDLVVMANDGTNGLEVLNYLGVPEKNIYFPINGFTSEHIMSAKNFDFNSVTQAKYNIVMLSKLKSWKRVDRGLVILEKLLKQNLNVHLHVIGMGEMYFDLVDFTNDKKLNNNVTFHKNLENSHALSLLKSADLFWSFYDISNLGNPILEAAYLGIPIQTIKDNSTIGILSESNRYLLSDIDKIASDAIKILTDTGVKQDYVKMSVGLKNKLISWEDRMKMEIDWIEAMLTNDKL